MTDDLHLARVEARYRQAVQEELGLEQGCAAILTLSLPDPELPQEIGLDERRLLAQAQRTGGLPPEQALHLEAFRFQRRKRQLLTAWSEPPSTPSRSSEEQTPWEEALDTPLCVLQGESGSGKSTLLRRAAVRQARRKQSLDGRRPTLPLYLPLAAATPLDSVELPILVASYWRRRWPLTGLDQVFLGALDAGRALVLIDEVDARHASHEYPGFLSKLVQGVHRWGGTRGNHFVLARRPLTRCELPGLDASSQELLLGVAPEGVEQLSRRLYELWGQAEAPHPEPERKPAPEEALALVEALRRVPRVGPLASSPRALPRLMMLRRTLGRFPPRMTEFYEAYVHQCLKGREAALSPLMELALLLRRHRPSGVVSQEDVAPILRGWSDERWRELLAEGTLVVEQGEDRVSFLVPELGDFLAGRALAHRSAEERWRLLEPRLHDPLWSDTVRMCAGLLADRGGPELTELVRGILSANSEFEPVLHRDVLLAADVALAVSGRGLAGLLDTLAERLWALEEDPTPLVRQRALIRLAGLERLGHEPARLHVQACVDKSSRQRNFDLWEHWRVNTKDLRRWLESMLPRAWELLEVEPPPRKEEAEAEPESPENPASLRQALLRGLHHPDPLERLKAIWGLQQEAFQDEQVRQGLLECLEDTDWAVRHQAAKALTARFSRDSRVRGVLLHHLERVTGAGSDELAVAMSSLAANNRGMRQYLLRRLEDRSHQAREFMVNALAGQVESDAEVRRALLARAVDDSMRVRSDAIDALARAAGDEEVRRVLLERLERDDSYWPRLHAAEALAGQTQRVPQVRHALVRWLETALGDESHHSFTLGAVKQAAGVEEVRRVLLECLEGPSEGLSAGAVESLQGSVDTDEAFRQRMLGWLEDAQAHRRRLAARALRQRVKSDERVRHALQARLADPDNSVRNAVLSALAGWEGSDKAFEQACLAELEDADPLSRLCTLRIMRQAMGPREPLRRAALERLSDPDGEVREAALDALASIGVEDEEVYRRIRERLEEDPVKGVRFHAAAALAHRLEREPALVEVLLPWVGAFSVRNDSHRPVRRELIPRLAALAARDPRLLDRITLGLRSREWHRREGTALVLLALPGELPSAWIFELRRLLDDLGEDPFSIERERLSSSEVASALLNAPDPTLQDQALAYVLEGFEHLEHSWFHDALGSRQYDLLGVLNSGWKPLSRDERVLAHVLRLLQEPPGDKDRPPPSHRHRDGLYEILLSLASVPKT